MVVVDISYPENLREISDYFVNGYFYDVAYRDNYVYIADLHVGMRVVDFSNIANPHAVAFEQLAAHCNQIYLYNDLAYISALLSGVHIVDISDPEHPQHVNTFDTPERAESLEIRNNVAFVADGISGLRVYSVDDPENPVELATYNTNDNAYDITIRDNFAFVADRRGGLVIFDISDFLGEMPDIQIEPQMLEFGACGIGEELDLPVTVSNVGDAVLDITSIDIPDERYSGEFEDEYQIEPGESIELRVVFSPDAEEECQGLLTIISNDPDEQNVRIPLTGRGLPPVCLALTEGWSAISLNIFPSLLYYDNPKDPGASVELMMEQLSIDDESHHLDLFKDLSGGVYAPPYDFNNIPFWDLNCGYLVKVDEDVEVQWVGERVPADREIWLNANWNLMPYYPSYELEMSCPDFYALSLIIDNVQYAKDDMENFFMPEYNFSNMPPWQPGKAYFVKLTQDTPFAYPPEQENLAGNMERQHF